MAALVIAGSPLVFADSISLQQTTWVPLTIRYVDPDPLAILPPAEPGKVGTASWYSESDPFINLLTANGEIFDDSKLTCASWNYPFNTRLKVTNLENGKSIVCRVNDRGPAKRLNRAVDLTKAAFRQIADPRLGLIRVRVHPLTKRLS